MKPLDHTETIQLPGTSYDFELKTRNLHRIIYRDMYDMTVVCNIPALDEHLIPIRRINKYKGISKL